MARGASGEPRSSGGLPAELLALTPAEAKERLAQTERTLADLTTAHEALRAHAAEAGERHERRRMAALEAAEGLLERDRLILAAEHAEARARLDADGLRSELAGTRRELHSQLAFGAAWKLELTRSGEHVARLEAELAERDAQLGAQAEQLAAQSAQLDAIRRTRAWRLVGAWWRIRSRLRAR